MTAVRGAMLFWAVLAILFVIEAGSGGLQPSAMRVAAGGIVVLLAPLFWPGCAATPVETAARVLAWTAMCCGIAVLAVVLLNGSGQSWPAMLQSCAMLAAVLFLAHAAAVPLERLRARSAVEACNARQAASRIVALSLALLGSLPLWLGPAAELLSGRHAWTIDAVLGLSPLTHLAVASGNDLLRNQWLYQHSNLSGLQFDYPGLPTLAWTYGSLCLLAGAIALTTVRRGGAGRTDNPLQLPEEKKS